MINVMNQAIYDKVYVFLSDDYFAQDVTMAYESRRVVCKSVSLNWLFHEKNYKHPIFLKKKTI